MGACPDPGLPYRGLPYRGLPLWPPEKSCFGSLAKGVILHCTSRTPHDTHTHTTCTNSYMHTYTNTRIHTGAHHTTHASYTTRHVSMHDALNATHTTTTHKTHYTTLPTRPITIYTYAHNMPHVMAAQHNNNNSVHGSDFRPWI